MIALGSESKQNTWMYSGGGKQKFWMLNLVVHTETTGDLMGSNGCDQKMNRGSVHLRKKTRQLSFASRRGFLELCNLITNIFNTCPNTKYQLRTTNKGGSTNLDVEWYALTLLWQISNMLPNFGNRVLCFNLIVANKQYVTKFWK